MMYMYIVSPNVKSWLLKRQSGSAFLVRIAGLCQALCVIVDVYPKRIRLFEEIQNEDKNEKGADDYQILHLQHLSPTRWTTRVKAVDVILEKANELRKTLETLKDDPCIPSDTKARIRGILQRQFSSQRVLFNLNMTQKLL